LTSSGGVVNLASTLTVIPDIVEMEVEYKKQINALQQQLNQDRNGF